MYSLVRESHNNIITYDAVIDYMALTHHLNEVLRRQTTSQFIGIASRTILEHLFNTSSAIVSGGKLMLIGTQDIVDYDMLQQFGFINCNTTAEIIVCQKAATEDASNLTAWGFWGPCHIDGCRQSRVGLTNAREWVKDERDCLNGTHGCKIRSTDAQSSSLLGNRTVHIDEPNEIQRNVFMQLQEDNVVDSLQERNGSLSVASTIKADEPDNISEHRSLLVETTDLPVGSNRGEQEFIASSGGYTFTEPIHEVVLPELPWKETEVDNSNTREHIEHSTGGDYEAEEHKLDEGSLVVGANVEDAGKGGFVEETGGWRNYTETLHDIEREEIPIARGQDEVIPFIDDEQLSGHDALLVNNGTLSKSNALAMNSTEESGLTSTLRDVSLNASDELNGHDTTSVAHIDTREPDLVQETSEDGSERVVSSTSLDSPPVMPSEGHISLRTRDVSQNSHMPTLVDNAVELTTINDMEFGLTGEPEAELPADEVAFQSEELAYSSSAASNFVLSLSDDRDDPKALEETSVKDIIGNVTLEGGVVEDPYNAMHPQADGHVETLQEKGSHIAIEKVGLTREQQVQDKEVISETAEGADPLEGYEYLEAATDGCDGAPNGQCLDLFS